MSKLSNAHFAFFLILLNINFLSFTQGQSCLSFDGQNDQVTIPTAVGQSLGANHFTFEAWVTGNESDIGHGTILSNRTGINSGLHLAFHDYWGGSNHKMLTFRYNGVNWLHINNGSFNAKILDGTCHHVAVTRDDTALSFYVDGNLIGSNNMTVDIDLNTDMPIWVGADPQSNSPFAGNISDVRIWKVARTAAELQDGMANGVDPNAADLIGAWAMNEGTGQTVSDLTNQNNAFLGSTDSNEGSDPNWGSDCCSFTPAPTGDCLTFDGQDDQVTIPAAVGQSLGANHFTFEAWVTGNESDIGHGTILSNRTGINSGLHLAFHDYWGGSNHKMLTFRYNGVNWLHINNGSFNAKILDGTCHHVAVTRDDTALSFYVDGNLIGSNNMTVDIDLNTDMPIWVGADPQSNSPFAGNISDVRIWKVARTAAELQDGMANGVDPNAADLIGAWAMNEGTGQTVSDLTNQNNAFLGSTDSNEGSDPNWGSDCCSFTPAPTGDCLTFDGQDDQVTIPAAVGQSLGANHFTFEAWVTGNESDIGHGTILSNRTGINSGLHLAFHDYWGGSNHKMLTFRYNGVNWLHINNGSFNAKILDGTCHHVAVTRDDTALSFYVDGNLIGSNNMTVDIDLNTDMPIWLGADPQSNSPFAGNIGDVRIWRVARTAAELQDGMANGVDPNSSGLLGYWEMNEGTGQIIPDLRDQNNAVLGSTDSNEGSDPTWGNECCFSPLVISSTNNFGKGSQVLSLSIYPNPGTGLFHIDFDAGFEKDKFNFSVYDVLGRLVDNGIMLESTIDLQELPSGQYWLKVADEIGNVGIAKVLLLK